MSQNTTTMLSFRNMGQNAALLGGSALIAHYSLQLLYGLQTRRILWEAMNTPLGKLDGIVFAGAFAAIDLAVLSVCAQTDKRAPWLSRAGGLFAVYALIIMLVGEVAALAGKMLPFAFSTGCLTMFLGALLAGIAVLRTKTFAPRVGWLMIGFALFTAPVAILLPNVRGPLPEYIVEELHFVFAGLVWLVIHSLLRTRRTAQAGCAVFAPA